MLNTSTDHCGSRTTTRHGPTARESAEHGATRPCDLVTVPARQGLEAVDILRLRDGVGPVLQDGPGDTLGFLVPPGTAEGWDLPGSACVQTCRHSGWSAGSRSSGSSADPAVGPVAGPEGPTGSTDGAAPPVAGTGWLVSPEEAYDVATEPSVLRAALGEAARTLAAAGRRV